MADYDYDVGIIGGGSGGLTVAAGSARFGAKTILIEKEGRLGGDCLHYGCVPSKTLIRTANVYHTMKNARRFGLPEVRPGPVDFREVRRRIKSVIDTIQKHDSPERFCELGARVEFGNPVFTDEHTVRVDGRSFTARSWVISTGSSPAVPPVEGLDRTPFLTNKEIFYLDSLPGSMITIGAGPIAIEMAQAFARLGTRVTVVQRGNQILSKEDRDMADLLMEALRADGVEFFLNTAILGVRDLGAEREVTVKTPEGGTMGLRAEAILVAVGREPNLSGLGLEDIGVEYSGRGLVLDRRLRTTQRHIYGVGDVTGDHIFTHAAGYEGGVALANAVLRLPRKADYTFLPWCTYTHPELASIGMNEKRAREAGAGYSVWTEEFRANDRSLAEGERVGKVKMLLDERGRPLGVQILGPHAGELIGEWVAALSGNVKLSTLAGAVHPYPTLGEINKRVAGDYIGSRLFSEKVRKGLRFFFGLKGRACVPEEKREP
ncbi:MAG: FAD-dependent oxidoreductase [Thermodesulfovibrionales bacterium]